MERDLIVHQLIQEEVVIHIAEDKQVNEVRRRIIVDGDVQVVQ